jgi:penicillin-binding protein 1A
MKKLKVVIGTIGNILLISVLALSIYAIYYIYSNINALNEVKFSETPIKSATYIFDNANVQIKAMNENRKMTVTYEELSDHFINALVSIEDEDFFKHNGLDYGRLLASIYQNVVSGEIVAGGSTLTQQLVKNATNQKEQTLSRKIKEAYLALQLERNYSKEELLTLYANQILFDGVNKGVNAASLKYFNKEISEVTLPEAALLAALVKSPTIYNPITHPENCFKRKNLVLEMMYQNNYITNYEKEMAQKMTIDELLYKPSYEISQTYPYQAYLDIVYQEIKDITGYDPYYTPMKIYTYLDSELQLQLDLIQKGADDKVIISDENQQLSAAVIDNNTGAIIGVIGGKNYQGEKLFNRAYNMKRQPASTIKPLLSYALALENLNWSDIHVISDTPYKYPNTDIEVHNVDDRYMGELFIEEALGYSRNTAAIKTLEAVVNEIGMYQVAEYLDKIGILDVSYDLVNYAYGLGGMYEGVSPVQLAAAYRIFANNGIYSTPTTIKKIELLDGSNTVYYPNVVNNQVLSKETAYMMTNLLVNVVNKNYWNIGYVKVNDVNVAAKTGTSNFDENQARVLGYPLNANKDIWFSGFTPDISLAVWTGFDKALPNQNTYFKASGDSRVALARTVFRRIIEIQAKRNLQFIEPDSLYKIQVVKGTYPYLLGDEYTPSSMLISGYFKENNLPNNTIKMPPLEKMKEPQILLTNNELEINFLDNLIDEEKLSEGKVIFDYSYIYGSPTHFIDVYVDDIKIDSYQTTLNNFKLILEHTGIYKIKIYYRYAKDKKISTPDYEFTFSNTDLIDIL